MDLEEVEIDKADNLSGEVITPAGRGATPTLREKVLRGGAFLAFRQAIGVVLGVAGVLLVTRVIGPGAYGRYSTAMGPVVFLSFLGTWGVDVYLLRKAEMPTRQEFNQAFTLLLCISGLFYGGVVLCSHLIAASVRMPVLSQVLPFLALAIPFNLLGLPAIVKLDRDLDFRQVAINELISQASMYVVGVPMAFAGAGVWAPACGFVTQQFVLMALSYRSARYMPSLCWDRDVVRSMLKYGLAYSSSTWIWQLRGLVNPFIVGRFVGAEAVGYIAVSIRFVEVLSFAKQATWRIAMAALTRIHDDSARLRASVTEGMKLQAIAVGFPLALFALIGPFLISLGLGHNWGPALIVYPFIAVSYLFNAMFNLHSSILYLKERNLEVTMVHIVHMILFAGSAVLLVPRFGLIGYGWAELTTLLSYSVLHYYFVRQVAAPSYSAAAVWFAAMCSVLVLSCLKAPFMYLGFLMLLLPWVITKERNSLMGYAKVVFPWMARA